MTHPQVTGAAVCGVYNEGGTSEIPVAYVATDTEGSQDQQALRANLMAYVNGQVARYKRINGGVHILPAIPRKWVDLNDFPDRKSSLPRLTDIFHSALGKILRRLLPANLAAAAAKATHATPNTQRLARL